MKITWYGHSCFRVEFPADTATGQVAILLDPFLSGNPAATATPAEVAVGLDHIIASHGHDDHVGDLVEIARASGATVTGNWEIAMWAAANGVNRVNPMNTGGTVDLGAFKVTLTPAQHSSSRSLGDGRFAYMGNANGVVVEAKGQPTLYYAGDTDMFSDMALIEEFHAPKIGILPIGDRFTMGGRKAGVAAKRYFHFTHVVPCHYRTFDLLDQTPDALAAELEGSGITLLAPKPGGSVEIG
jgi:L-ascorbate metabolism protein UlaG (beta-lactamase superfamily)